MTEQRRELPIIYSVCAAGLKWLSEHYAYSALPDYNKQSENCGLALPGDSNFLPFLVCSLFLSLPRLTSACDLWCRVKGMGMVVSGNNATFPNTHMLRIWFLHAWLFFLVQNGNPRITCCLQCGRLRSKLLPLLLQIVNCVLLSACAAAVLELSWHLIYIWLVIQQNKIKTASATKSRHFLCVLGGFSL